ncbi:unnamed protein product [Caenorhabditis brenneri]
MTKSAVDPDDSKQNKSKNDAKTDIKAEKTTKTDEKKESSLKMSKTLIAIILGGFIFSLLASYGWQKYRAIYVIPLENERIFQYGYHLAIIGRTIRNMEIGESDDAVLKLYNIDKLQDEPLRFYIKDNETTLTLDQFDFFEYGTAELYKGGKFTFFYKNLQGVIEYAINRFEDIVVSYSVTGTRLDGTPKNLFLTLTRGGSESVTFSSDNAIHEFPGRTTESDVVRDKVDIEETKKEWENRINSVFSTGQQQLPKAYLELVEAAYGFIANSFHARRNIGYIGVYQNFTRSFREMFFIQPHNYTLTSLDEQLYGLITLSKLDEEDTTRVVYAWMTTVNKMEYMGNIIKNENIVLDKIQAPLLFQLLKQFYNYDINDKIWNHIAEITWKNSIGIKGLEDVKFLGSSRGIFGLERATSNGTSSFELLCLLRDMARSMEKHGDNEGFDGPKWAQRVLDIDAAMNKYWDNDTKQYGDLENGKVKPGQSTYVPLILGILKPDSENLKHLLQNLQQDPNFLPFGLQLSEEQGVQVGPNYLLIESLKYYSGQSGPSQELAHNMYSVLKNHLAAVIARTYRADRSFYGSFDKNMKPLGPKGHPDGTLIFRIMAA